MTASSAIGAPEPDALLQLADQCVKCGYCLPACPTFGLEQTEAESPRGRIALIQGWLNAELPPSRVLFQHLDQCLECRACEAVCPSLVRFGDLMDGARALRQARRPWWQRGLRQRWLQLLSQPRWLGLFALWGWLTRLGAHLRRPAWRMQRWPGLRIMGRLSTRWHLPRQPQRATPSTTTPSNTVPRIGLFLGCVARGTQGASIDAARRLLTQLHIPYTEPQQQGCCGALLHHHGFVEDAAHQLAQNAQAFRGLTLVGFASACVLELQRHEALRAEEICHFLIASGALTQVAPRPLTARVWVHEPCSQRLLPGGASAIYQLLALIPNLELQPLAGNDSCCGAAGSYLIEHAHTALALLEPKLQALRAQPPDYLVTTNSGCALHLASGLAAAGLDIPVLHPIELLERQLRPLQQEPESDL
ncbi:(Fe-S)-binding protein [Rhabdochromatium marinum]|uniref:(Fe-S)-binding protein n=1 Tax=Rhabdochromatium marinum TaxID=48729 RepID=UPI0019058F18|nr:(Fe-S)-binding protein [Rhabdochromatium marinum]MBK1649411.1 hypothetical protein [Rhabdochromatium marinum]